MVPPSSGPATAPGPGSHGRAASFDSCSASVAGRFLREQGTSPSLRGSAVRTLVPGRRSPCPDEESTAGSVDAVGPEGAEGGHDAGTAALVRPRGRADGRRRGDRLDRRRARPLRRVRDGPGCHRRGPSGQAAPGGTATEPGRRRGSGDRVGPARGGSAAERAGRCAPALARPRGPLPARRGGPGAGVRRRRPDRRRARRRRRGGPAGRRLGHRPGGRRGHRRRARPRHARREGGHRAGRSTASTWTRSSAGSTSTG